ncbi:MAG: AAA family ATPase [Fimbriimonadaceae bacterium]|nr:AAA family ATPase [Fimbriimonadaceae bacterium]
MTSPTDLVLARLEGVKGSRPKWVAKHPCYDDNRPSLGVTERVDGSVWLHSFNPAYDTDQVLRALGLEMRDLFPHEDRPQTGTWRPGPDGEGESIVAAYDYVDRDGTPLFRVCRTANKSFPVRAFNPDGTLGKWGLPKDAKRVLYRLPAVLDAVKRGATVWIAEGEKDVHALERAGVVATCNPGGAGGKGSKKWDRSFSEDLRGANVVIVGDKDEAGVEHVRMLVSELRGFVRAMNVVEAKTGKDAHDHLQHHGLEDFVRRKDLEPERGLVLETFGEDFHYVEPRFLWKPYLPVGKCVLLDADGGTGKTTFGAVLAACLSNGAGPNGEAVKPTRTLYLHRGEDTSEEIETIYRANHGKVGWLSYYRGKDLVFDEAGCARLEEAIVDEKIGLVVVDSLFYFCSGLIDDISSAIQALKVVERLTEIAQRTGATFVNLRHTVKGQTDRQASNIGMGSAQFRNSHRGQLVMRWHPDRENHAGLVVVNDEKGSLLVERGEHFCFKRIGREVQFVQGIENPFADGMAVAAKPKRGRAPVSRSACLDAVEAMLRDAPNGYVLQFEARTRIEDLGYGAKSLYDAVAQLGAKQITVTKRGRAYKAWSLDPFAGDVVEADDHSHVYRGGD